METLLFSLGAEAGREGERERAREQGERERGRQTERRGREDCEIESKNVTEMEGGLGI